jgi:hypothetical protein
VHCDGDRVLVWQSHRPEVAAAAVSAGAFGGPEWRLSRTTRFRLSLGSALERSAWGSKPERERLLGVWITEEAFARYLRQAVLAERNDALYGSVQAYRLATRWAQVLVSWHDDVDLGGVATGQQTGRFGLRQAALSTFTNGDVVGVEDWTDRVRADVFEAPALRDWPLEPAALQRITGVL